MRRADLDGRLAAFLNPSLAPPERAVAQVEGWIFGVALSLSIIDAARARPAPY